MVWIQSLVSEMDGPQSLFHEEAFPFAHFLRCYFSNVLLYFYPFVSLNSRLAGDQFKN